MKVKCKNGKQVLCLSRVDVSRIGSEFKKKAQDLSVVKELDTLNERELTRAIRDAIAAEIGAIKQYETLVDSTPNERAKKVLQAIADEEKVHIGELEALLKELSSDEQGFMDDGLKEVEDK